MVKEHQKIYDEILAKYRNESSALYSTSRVWDDGIIDPLQTRLYLAIGIEASRNKLWGEPKSGVYRM